MHRRSLIMLAVPPFLHAATAESGAWQEDQRRWMIYLPMCPVY